MSPKSFTKRPRQPPASRPSPPRRSLTWLAAALIIGAALVAYSNSYRGVFVFDDEPAIVQNPHIRRLWPLHEGMSAPSGTTLSGRPILSLTFAINYALAPAEVRDALEPPADASPLQTERFHSNLWGYHAFNLLVHIVSGLTLFGIVRRTLLAAPLRRRFDGSAAGLALATALLWTVHPVQTASVTYVVQRAESLMGLFFLLTLYCAIRAWQRPAWAIGSVVACGLGMGAKEVMVGAPLVVLLWDFLLAPSGSDRADAPEARTYLRQRAGLYSGLAATWILLIALVAGGHRPHAVGFGFEEWPWWRYLMTQSAVLTHYLRLSFVPSPLVLDYAWPPADRLSEIVLPSILVAGLLAGTLRAIVSRHPLGFPGGAFFLVLAPTSSVLPIVTEVAAEHRMYLPLAAVLGVSICGGFVLLRRATAMASTVTAVVVAGVVMAFGTMTRVRNTDYYGFERIWDDTVEKRPANARARNNYASALLTRGQYAAAEEQLRVALELEPDFAEAQASLGVALCARDRCVEGIPYMKRASELAPESADFHRNLAEALASRGELAAALASYEQALRLRPDDVMLLNRAGWLLVTDPSKEVRNGPRGVAVAERAVRLTKRHDVESLDTLAAAYSEVGRFDEAVSVAIEAIALAPSQHPAIVPELQARLALYREGRPFRQQPAAPERE